MNVRTADSDSTHRFSWNWSLKELSSVQKNGLKVFSCFSCGGGSSMGYKLAGYDVIGCCEIDPAMMKIYRQNNHPRFSYLCDIRDLLKQDLPEELYDLDILDGSPPCSVFSMAGKRSKFWGVEKAFREGQKEQRLDDLFMRFIDVAAELRPKVVVAENVKGLILKTAKGYVTEIISGFQSAGYDVQIFLLNSSRMGVPQKRERVFFVCRRKDLSFPELSLTFNEKVITFGEVREEHGIPVQEGSLSGQMIKLRVPTDRKLSDIAIRTRRKEVGYSNPINIDEEPAHTVASGGTVFRMCDGMKMTDRDFINVQTFPQDYDFMDQSVQYVCGMSVPPVMMANLAKEIEIQVFEGKKHE